MHKCILPLLHSTCKEPKPDYTSLTEDRAFPNIFPADTFMQRYLLIETKKKWLHTSSLPYFKGPVHARRFIYEWLMGHLYTIHNQQDGIPYYSSDFTRWLHAKQQDVEKRFSDVCKGAVGVGLPGPAYYDMFSLEAFKEGGASKLGHRSKCPGGGEVWVLWIIICQAVSNRHRQRRSFYPSPRSKECSFDHINQDFSDLFMSACKS